MAEVWGSLREHSLGMVSYDKEGRILSTRTRTSLLLVSRRVGMEQSSVCVKTKLGAHGRLTRAGRDLCLDLKSHHGSHLERDVGEWSGTGNRQGQRPHWGGSPSSPRSVLDPASSEVNHKSDNLTSLLIPSGGPQCILSKHLIA